MSLRTGLDLHTIPGFSLTVRSAGISQKEENVVIISFCSILQGRRELEKEEEKERRTKTDI